MTIILLLLFGAAVTFTVASNVFGQKTIIAKGIGVILVDVQGDFTEWKKGSLAVSGTDRAFVERVGNTTKFYQPSWQETLRCN